VPSLIQQTLHGHAVSLPGSIIEWFCLDPDAQLFHRLTEMPHYVVAIADLRDHIHRHRLGDREQWAVEVIFENQGCFVMAAGLEDGDDPPVWISEDFNFCGGAEPTWALHSHSFSECMQAFAWDFHCIDRSDWSRHFREVSSIHEIPEVERFGPTTYHRSAWFIASEFRRVELEGDPYTYLVTP
jgi:hypothetical protein